MVDIDARRDSALPGTGVPPTAHARRQRAYRERLRERGLSELRLRVPETEQDAVRILAERYVDGDPVLHAAAKLRPRPAGRPGLSRVLPWTGAQKRMLLGACVVMLLLGAGAGALFSTELDLAGARRAADEVPKLNTRIAGLTLERDEMQAALQAARAEAQRLATDQSAIRAALTALSSGVGGLRADLRGQPGTGASALPGAGLFGAALPSSENGVRDRQPTPPGPKLVPLAGAFERPTDLLPRFDGVNNLTDPKRYRVHQFLAGDTMESVARQYGTSPQAIMDVNDQLRPQPWRYGDRIVVPIGETGESTR